MGGARWTAAVARWLAAVLVAAAAGAASAQVVREDGVGSIAGLLRAPYDDFTLKALGDEILFADLDADVYQTRGRRAHDDEGSCGGHDSGMEAVDPATAHETEDGHESGGPGGLCLQVIDSAGQLLCWADRPARPGWQRDPALACPLPATRAPETYTLRVAMRGAGESPCARTDAYPSPPEHGKPYLLGISLRKIAPAGAIERALAASNSAL